MRFVIALIATALFATSAQADSHALKGDAIKALIAGNTLVAETQLPYFADRKDKTFYLHIKTDGALKILTFLGDIDTGKWEITDEGLYCSQYDNTRKGKKSCYRVEKTKTGYQFFDARRKIVSSTFIVKPGNAKGL